jgi:hypothetical protein
MALQEVRQAPLNPIDEVTLLAEHARGVIARRTGADGKILTMPGKKHSLGKTWASIVRGERTDLVKEFRLHFPGFDVDPFLETQRLPRVVQDFLALLAFVDEKGVQPSHHCNDIAERSLGNVLHNVLSNKAGARDRLSDGWKGHIAEIDAHLKRIVELPTRRSLSDKNKTLATLRRGMIAAFRNPNIANGCGDTRFAATLRSYRAGRIKPEYKKDVVRLLNTTFGVREQLDDARRLVYDTILKTLQDGMASYNTFMSKYNSKRREVYALQRNDVIGEEGKSGLVEMESV